MRLSPFFSARAALLLMAHISHTQALSQTYCSTENTGSDYSAVYSIYQSNGLCYDACLSDYAYAVVQYQDCWCTNYAPADQVNVSECSTDCPGYPEEQCGNQDDGLYGYITLTRSPSGTAGASSSTTSSAQASTTSTQTSSSETSTTQSSTEQQSTTTTTSDSTSYSYSSTSVSATSTTSYSSSTTPSSSTTTSISKHSSSSSSSVAVIVAASSSSTTSGKTKTPSPVTATTVVTVSGAVITQTVTSTPAPYVDPDSEQLTGQRKSVSGGTIAGAVVGSLVGLALLGLIAFILLRRRRGNKRDSTASSKLNRNASVLSKAGLLSSARAADAEKNYDEPAPFMSQNPQRNSFRNSLLYGDYDDGPVISAPAGIYETGSQASKRNSRPLVYDQRLNPHALMQNYDLNGSRGSVNTMQDQRDYSRPLGIANPDVD